MTIKILFLFASASLFLLSSCKKDRVDTVTTPTTFKFESLTADTNEIIFSSNPSVTVTAIVTGDGTSFRWSASAGNIAGSGAKVTYYTNLACCGGYQSITCIAKDKYGKTDVKQFQIYVRRF